MKKIYFTICGLLMLGASAFAATTYKSIELIGHDGSTTVVAIEENMAATIADGCLNLTCDKGDVSFELSEVSRWVYSNADGDDFNWSAISSIKEDAMAVVLRNGGELTLKNIKAGEKVSLVSLDGRVVNAGVASEGADYNFNISELTSGVYVVTYGNKSLKIAIR